MENWLRMTPLRTAEFVAELSSAPRLTSVINPWRDPALQANLLEYLEAYQKVSLRARWRALPVLIVGEALGYKGGRNTGIPFSSSTVFSEVEHPFLQTLQPRLQIATNDSEATASIVWQYLAQKRGVPLFWNAFPFHPHVKHRPNSNRKPTVKEVRRGVPYLRQLAEIFQPQQIAGLGRVGQEAAQVAFPDEKIVYIRHPSYGGKRDFIRGMDALL
jgi:uracil-DNA glycosylase